MVNSGSVGGERVGMVLAALEVWKSRVGRRLDSARPFGNRAIRVTGFLATHGCEVRAEARSLLCTDSRPARRSGQEHPEENPLEHAPSPSWIKTST